MEQEQEVVQVTEVKRSNFYPKFHADGAEYAKIWIVNTLLTVLTLGLYSAWAKVRTLKYMYGSTELDSSRFDFTGSPIAILKGRLLAALMMILYIAGGRIHPAVGVIGIAVFFFCAPWIFTKSLQFKLGSTTYRNISFSFRGSVKDAYKIWYKYATVPFILNAISASAGFFIKDPTAIQEQLPLLLIPGLISFIYVMVILSRALSEIFNFVYKNIYYGDVKTDISSDKSSVGSEIIKKYVMTSLMGFGVLLVLGVLSALVKPLTFLVVIFAYIFIILQGLYFQFLITKHVWTRLSTANDDTSLIKMEFAELAKISLINILLSGITFGLYYPWAAVKLKKYKIENRGIKIDDFDKFEASTIKSNESALGSELDGTFDIGFEIGL